jgi:glycosyltransferase involved in cell wall biosynthesis
MATLHQSFKQRIQTKKGSGVRQFYYHLAEYLAEIPALRRADGLMAVSTATMNSFTDQYGVPLSKITITRHGIDTGFFKPVEDVKKLVEVRAQFNIDDQIPIIMFAGFVTPRKGLEHLAQAMRMIRPIPYLVISGKWSAGSRETFFDHVGEVSDRVIELGFVSDKDMPYYFSLADVYVSPSVLEGFGLPIAEALACETPVVAAETGSVKEVVGPGGLLVPPRDPESLARAVSNLLQDPGMRTALGKAGRQHIAENFSTRAMVSNTIGAYQKYAIGWGDRIT